MISTEYGYTDKAINSGEFRLIRITDIDDWGRLLKNNAVFVEIKSKNIQEKYLLNKGDLLLVRTGATFGKMLFFEDTEKAVFASYLIRIKPINNKIDKKYLWYYSFSPIYWKQARKLVEGGTQPQFNANKIIKITIPLPPLEVQREIVAELDKEMKTLEQVQVLKKSAEGRVNKILDEFWGSNKQKYES